MPSRKRNDAEARALRRFCDGWAPSSIDAQEGKPMGWARECVVRWWAADKAYRGISLEDYLGRGM